MSLFIPKDECYLLGPTVYLPERIVDNEELIRWMGAKIRPSWIETRTGIRQRHWAGPKEACSDLACHAGEALLSEFPEYRADVRQIVLATISGDFPSPPTAPLVQDRLALNNAGAFDVAAACAGFITGLHLASTLFASTRQTQLLIAADTRSKFLNPADFATSALFGDGAAACLIVGSKPKGAAFRYRGSRLFSDGSIADIISVPAGGSREPMTLDPNIPQRERSFIKMGKGAELFIKAVHGMTESSRQFASDLGWDLKSVRWIVPHQANLHILKEVAKNLDLPQERFVETLSFTGNTSGASVGIALHHLSSQNSLQDGDRVFLLSAGGGGLAACAALEYCS